jgi:hypothetical protein
MNNIEGYLLLGACALVALGFANWLYQINVITRF